MNCNYCLIGHPLGHSVSPEIHARLFCVSSINAEYTLDDISPENFSHSIEKLKSLGGFNITIPYKQLILPYLDDIEVSARRFSAVNTVKCENGKLFGFNTDIVGFGRALKSADIPLRGRVLLCGAGGVSHMMACEALDHDCSLVVATRELSSALRFADALRSLYPAAEICAQTLSDACGKFDLILNGTPSGMYPNTDSCPVAESVVQNSSAVFDAVYNPCETRLIKTARAAGIKTQGGTTMLVWQAAAAQEIWTGTHFDEEDIKSLCGEMETLILKRYSPAHNDSNHNGA